MREREGSQVRERGIESERQCEREGSRVRDSERERDRE